MHIDNGPLTEQDVRDFLDWRYDAPYNVYNMGGESADETIAFFLDEDNGYFALHDEDDTLIGFCCFGVEGQVPGGDYSLDALDVGIGMRPELTGQGLGYAFVDAVLTYAEKTYVPQRLRATIAVFNLRSQRVFEHHGFRRTSHFLSMAACPREYVILVKEKRVKEERIGPQQSASTIDAKRQYRDGIDCGLG